MLKYHAAYYRYPDSDWVIARVLDFPGVVSQGRTMTSARRMIRDALRLMAECTVEAGEPLPMPRKCHDKKAVFQEVIGIRMQTHAGSES